MPRKRKYDYQSDYPVVYFIRLKVGLLRELEELGLVRTDIEKIVEKSLLDYVKKIGKKVD